MIFRHGFTCRHQFQVSLVATLIQIKSEIVRSERKNLANDYVDGLIEAWDNKEWKKFASLRDSLASLIDLDRSIEDIPVSINSSKRRLNSE